MRDPAASLHRYGQLAPGDLRRALSDQQLFLAYQPQISSYTGVVTGFEALVRWQHPELGTIMPGHFISMAESCALIDELTDRVLDLGLGWLSRSFPGANADADRSTADVTLSINISAASLCDHDFVAAALRACERHHIDPCRLILEVTEAGAMRDPAATLDQLTRMRIKGFQLSIDDFGTGFSSMLQLARLPFSELKVDKSFVTTAVHSVESRAVVRSVVELGRSLGLRTVAEGVENVTTLEFLKGIGCDSVQGYFIARPMPGSKGTAWNAARRPPMFEVQRLQSAAAGQEEIESFQWDEGFVTGLVDVHRQHRRLMALIKRLASTVQQDEPCAPDEISALFAELEDYADHHFCESDRLLRRISKRNHALRETNRILQTRLAERTAALSDANWQFATIAMTDSLTGIPNRRHALMVLGQSWGDALVEGWPLSCLMIGADHLKAINDRYGHAAGDEMLKALAAQLRDAARTDDFVCRLSGDEFLVIAPRTPLDGALQLAEKIRSQVCEMRVPTSNGKCQGSVSIGVAVLDQAMDGPEDLIKSTDDALHKAKRAGRNIVEVG
jgi:diguanylate cyclase (GGDEF)-like protein